MTISFGAGDSMTDDAFLFDQIDQRLADIPLLHRSAEMKRAFKRGADAVATRYHELLPRSLRQKSADAGIHVADMPDEKVKEYETSIVAVAGIERGRRRTRKLPPNIDWLLEWGHRIVVGGTAERIFTPDQFNWRFSLKKGRVLEPRRRHAATKSKRTGVSGQGRVVGHTQDGNYLQKAISQTENAAKAEIIETLNRAIDRLTA